MSMRTFAFILIALAGFAGALPAASTPHACVWRVTDRQGHQLYLGGSMHSLLGTDYPLPPAYNRAFDATSALVLEDDVNVSMKTARKFYSTGFYQNGDSIKNHLDPRTYDYLRRFFALAHVPEARWTSCKPWMLLSFS